MPALDSPYSVGYTLNNMTDRVQTYTGRRIRVLDKVHACKMSRMKLKNILAGEKSRVKRWCCDARCTIGSSFLTSEYQSLNTRTTSRDFASAEMIPTFLILSMNWLFKMQSTAIVNLEASLKTLFSTSSSIPFVSDAVNVSKFSLLSTYPRYDVGIMECCVCVSRVNMNGEFCFGDLFTVVFQWGYRCSECFCFHKGWFSRKSSLISVHVVVVVFHEVWFNDGTPEFGRYRWRWKKDSDVLAVCRR